LLNLTARLEAVPFPKKIAKNRVSFAFYLDVASDGGAQLSRVKYHREVCSLSRPVMLSVQPTQPISAPLQNSIRFLPDVMPAPPSVRLAVIRLKRFERL